MLLLISFPSKYFIELFYSTSKDKLLLHQHFVLPNNQNYFAILLFVMLNSLSLSLLELFFGYAIGEVHTYQNHQTFT